MEGDAGARRLNPTLAPENDEMDSGETTLDSAASYGDDAAAPGDSAPGVVEDAGPASRLATRGWVVTACVVLLVLSALIAGGGLIATITGNRADQREGNEAAAVQAAKDCVIATQAPDAAAMAASQRRIVECSTGDFAAQAALYSGVLVDAYAAAKAQVQVSNIRAAVERHNDDGSMDVLVALRVKMSNANVSDQESGYRLRVRMAPDGGTYKIAKLDQVTR
ncbi:hypothetical protein [Mycobacterium sp. ACS4331]|uniref:hypothetical protein n=1 Tax=Mycobacterium sp. ACS4331 TaxID=1834121 RepID=UPI0007FF440E|nr:hypothetical protein [Mycobacterium sp. ACS4331]OBF18421.1 hypothetical protein A5727_11100 [Mycobacterium sp. ACS4331]